MTEAVQQARQEIARLAEVLAANPGACVYCGMPATVKDHITPRAISGMHTYTVDACYRCNSILGCYPVPSVPRRAALIAERERAKNRKLLRMPEWSDREVSQLGWHLRQHVLRKIAARDILVWRLRNLDLGGIGNADFTVIDFEMEAA